MKIRLFAAAGTLALSIALATFAQEPEEHHHHHDGEEVLGTVNFPVSCSQSVEAQFTRGMALLYSFEYEESQQAFEKVSAADSKCAMAKWGQAMSLYHQLWDPPNKQTLQRGAKLMAEASKLKAPTAREREYIGALAVFYTN